MKMKHSISPSPEVQGDFFLKKALQERTNVSGKMHREYFTWGLMIRSCKEWRKFFTNAFSNNLNINPNQSIELWKDSS